MKIRNKSQLIYYVIQYLILGILTFITIAPLVLVFFASFKTNKELLTTGVLTLPENWFNFENYITAWTKGNMATGFFNTILILVASITATILTGTMTAYVLSRFEFRMKGLVKFLFLTASLIPSITMQMSTFQIIVGLGLYNTRWATIILFAGTDIISIYIFLQFLDNISYSLDEAAIMDGCSFPRIFFRIIMPLLKPAVVTVIIIKGIGFYNEFYTPYLYMKDKELQVISTSLYAFQGPYGTQWEIICAACVITMLPALVVFLLLQKHIYSGLTAGAVKG
ncbi:MAG: carbohydrate ABC transporter permease [Lachnospiraceae bacterium]|nr:carbohydrate ABC transporter permease [Lachnospiraceae bacterium]